jgi:isopentenyl-diphosphate delta-isomerase
MNTSAWAQEQLLVVDEADLIIGHASKQECHQGEGLLHRAFSVYLFDPKGRLLLQQRSEHKPLWPLFWSNSCCSHPRQGEELEEATVRRTHEELGVQSQLHYIDKFQYQACFEGVGSEREICSLFAGTMAKVGRVDPAEVADHQFLEPGQLDQELQRHPEHYTPWLRLGWQLLRQKHWSTLASHLRLSPA